MLNFNGVDIPKFVKVKRVDISALPSINPNIKGSSSSFGVLTGKTQFKEKYIKATISIVIPSGYSLQKCGRELAVWLKGNDFDLSPLIIKDDSTVRYMAKVSNSVDLSDLLYVGEGEIEFVVPSGCGEAVAEKTASGTSKAVINYLGSHRAFPIIEVTIMGVASTITITNTQKGESIYLNGSFKSGDKILIDCNKHLVKLNNEVHMELIGITSKFLQLDYGATNILCSASNSQVKVTFRERYL